MQNKQIACKLIAAYKGDTFLIVDNIRKVAEYLGVTVDTVHYYCSPTYHERKKNENGLKCYRIEEEEE